MNTEDNAFEFDEDGFSITWDGRVIRVEWRDITKLNVYKRDLLIMDRVEMEIVCNDSSFSISEDLPGWPEFVAKTKEVFPEIAQNWLAHVLQPPFATNFTTIYKKY